MDKIIKKEASLKEIYHIIDKIRQNRKTEKKDERIEDLYKQICYFKSFIKFFKKLKSSDYIDENLKKYIELYQVIFEEASQHKDISMTGFQAAAFQEKVHASSEILFGIYQAEEVWAEGDDPIFRYTRNPRISKVKVTTNDTKGNHTVTIYTQDNTNRRISKRDMYEFKFYEDELLFNHYQEFKKIDTFKDKYSEEIKYYDNCNDLTSMDDGENLVVSTAIAYNNSEMKSFESEEDFI